ncbi:ArsC/Spx/MgsR family protein [Methyloferula stellata]|uniref:ArsC/Spx/MgsR family protein n=1 Tax=Methyloferula stellata TaxID=876270 RepID=UPI00036E9948|nr:ArsC/Spx/MgsR family protein [Methyloferula stellata]
MTQVIFYEKPGCSNNARQKQLLTAAGHELEIRDLLTEAWTADLLRSYFAGKPVADWFNKAAPKVKSGEIKPGGVDADTALALMLAEPILIRRPLMEAAGRRNVGFDPAEVEAWIGLEKAHAAPADLETCRRKPQASPDSPTPSVSETTPS